MKMGHEQNAYALSALADMSEWMAQRHPHQQYVYMPLAPSDTFPRNTMNYNSLPEISAGTPGQPTAVTAGPHQAPQRRPPLPATTQRSRQRQGPNQQQQQFVFQTPQKIYPHPQQQPGQMTMGQLQGQQQQQLQTPRMPVTFVNQTVASRKQSGGGSGGGKGQPRMLLPKMG
jgi:hypothetical protein